MRQEGMELGRSRDGIAIAVETLVTGLALLDAELDDAVVVEYHHDVMTRLPGIAPDCRSPAIANETVSQVGDQADVVIREQRLFLAIGIMAGQRDYRSRHRTLPLLIDWI